MRRNVLFAFFVVFPTILWNVTVADNILCDFTFVKQNNGIDLYRCDIELINDHSENGNTIKGKHAEGKTNEDVKAVRRWLSASINMTKFDSIFCNEFPNVEYFYSDKMSPITIVENALQDCKELKYFSVNYAEIDALPENFLPVPSKLSTFSFKSNKLTTLPELFFEHQNQLEEVILSENRIKVIYPKTFNSLTKLCVLKLDRSQIFELNPEWFTNLQNLEDLYLEANFISDIPRNTFQPLKSLRNLWLFNNHITAIHSQSFGIHKDLEVLSLFKNSIDAIDEGFVEKIFNETKVAELDVRGNTCQGEIIYRHTQWGEKLKKCFENYQTNILKIPKSIPTSQTTDATSTTSTTSTTTTSTTTTTTTTTEKVITSHPELSTEQSIIVVPTIENDSEESDFRSSIEQQPSCGVPKTLHESSVDSSYIQPHSHPWNAALMRRNGDYICGGTLVTSQKVVTGAYCFKQNGQQITLVQQAILVLLGAHDLRDSSEHSRSIIAVSDVRLHENWNPNYSIFDYDIAVIILERPVTFNDFIQPICLSSDNSIIESSNNLGYLVGFGYSEANNIHETIPRVIPVPMIAHQNCLQNLIASSSRTICGGWSNGTKLCERDNGSGLMVKYKGAYYLRGILTLNVKSGSQLCSENNRFVFTDIASYIPWINSIETSSTISLEELAGMFLKLGSIGLNSAGTAEYTFNSGSFNSF